MVFCWWLGGSRIKALYNYEGIMEEMYSRFYKWFLIQNARLKVDGDQVYIRGKQGKYWMRHKWIGPVRLLPFVVRRR